MNIAAWIHDVNIVLEQLKKKDLGYPHSPNVVLPPGDKDLLHQLLAEAKLNEDPQIGAFYELCDGISCPDIWNGYFIHTTKLALRSLRTWPVEISGPIACKILVFGSDGGGGLFAMQMDGPGKILYLPVDGVTGDAVFDGSLNPVKFISHDFFGFLDRVLADFRAFIDDRPAWIYMV